MKQLIVLKLQHFKFYCHIFRRLSHFLIALICMLSYNIFDLTITPESSVLKKEKPKIYTVVVAFKQYNIL